MKLRSQLNRSYVVMTKTLFLLATLAITISAHAQHKLRLSSPLKRVAFCELTTHPEKYVNKRIQTEANYIVWWESSYLYGDSCKDDDHKIHDNSDCTDNDKDCQKRFSLEWQKLEPYMRSERSQVQDTSRVKAVFVGRLVGPASYGHLDSFRYEFRIKSVGKVTAIPRDVSWEDL